MKTYQKITVIYFSMIILSCTAFKLADTKKSLSRHPRNPKVVYDSRYDTRDAGAETDILQFRDNFGPKVQEGISELVPSMSQSNLREHYQSFKDHAYNDANNHEYADRNYDFAGADVDIEDAGFRANEEHSTSFEHGFTGNFEHFDAGFGGEFFDNEEQSGEKKDPENEGSQERNPDLDGNEDLSA